MKQTSRWIYQRLPSKLQRAAQVIRDGMMCSVYLRNGRRFGDRQNLFGQHAGESPPEPDDSPNPLSTYFEANRQGHGIWKWRHYFDFYHSFLKRYINKPLVFLEIGIYSGGSLPMWRKYFGPHASIHGMDIEPACRSYAVDGVSVHIGDQSDRAFLNEFKTKVPRLNVVMDDGGHQPYQQKASFEELFPHLAPGGLYICEDIHRQVNPFFAFLAGLTDSLHAFDAGATSAAISSKTSQCQRAIKSITFCPFAVIIEKHKHPVDVLEAPKHGTLWQPFL